MKGGVIVECMHSEVVPEWWVDLVIVLRTDNTKLYDRLEKRGCVICRDAAPELTSGLARRYKPAKIQENVQYEIFGESAEEAFNAHESWVVKAMQSDTV